MEAMTEGRERELRARATRFDLSETPLQWVPGSPHASFALNTLHLVLPPGERWFCDVYRDALEHIDDPDLVDQVRGFIAQETTHAKAHDRGLAYLVQHDVDLRRAVAAADAVREWLRRTVRRLPRPIRHRVVVLELAVIAAIEHHTAVAGVWILDADALDAAGSDSDMLDLLRWHGAEEIEHRSVAFDVYEHVHGGYALRAAAGVVVALGLPAGLLALAIAMSWLAPDRKQRYRPGSHRRAVRNRLLPSLRWITVSVRHYLRHDYHPSRHGSLDQALAYLDRSPGVVRRGSGAAVARGY